MLRILPLLAVASLVGCSDFISLERLTLSETDGGSEGPSCGSITNQGCCSGQVLVFCTSGALMTKDCAPSAKCGWNNLFDLYTCGPKDKGDPSGQVPRDCPPMDLGIIDAPSGSDASGPDGGGCGALDYAGCCSSNVLHFCSGGQVLSLSCAKDPLCGWNAVNGFYDCGTSGTADPKGHHPLSCSEVLGDGGVRLDGALDQGTEQGPADVSVDSVDDGGPGLDVAEDGLDIPDGLPASDTQAVEDALGEEAVGLDASGLDVSPGDFRDIVASGGGGCAGCNAGPSGEGSMGPLYLLLMLALIVRARRGRNGL